MNNRFIIEQATNTLIGCRYFVYGEKLDYLVIPHQYNGMQIDRIVLRYFYGLHINRLCIEDGMEYLRDSAYENVYVLNVKLPNGLKICERCFANSQLAEILLPRDLQFKKEDFLNCRNLETISAEYGVNTISNRAFKRCPSLKEVRFCLIKSIRNNAFTLYKPQHS